MLYWIKVVSYKYMVSKNNIFIENKCHNGLLQKGLAALLKKNYLASQFYLKMYNIGMYLTELLKGNNAILYIYKKINGR